VLQKFYSGQNLMKVTLLLHHPFYQSVPKLASMCLVVGLCLV
jgi:hypothetical protein